MIEQLLMNSSYDTAPGQRDRWSKLLCNCRFYFYFRTYFNFYRIGRCSKQGRFDQAHQAFYSSLNFKVLEQCGAQIHLAGLDNLSSEKGPFVFVGNHMSSVETAILNAIISPRLDFTFVIKRDLFSVPFMGPAMRAIDAIGVDRENPRDDFKIIMHEGKRRLEQGRSVLIFPESTRQREFVPERFNSIGVKLAKSAGVKIIPFALKTDFIAPGRLIPDFGPIDPSKHIHFEFGAPIAVSDNGKFEHNEIIRFIAEKINHWQDLESNRSGGSSTSLLSMRKPEKA